VSRSLNLDDWLRAHLAGEPFRLAPASEDASFRRYFRVTTAAGTRIVMDAPPEHEDCRPFVKVARLFGQAGVNVPQVLAEDPPERVRHGVGRVVSPAYKVVLRHA
jgi:hypothetical protein